jgi:hypothetical protein
MTGSQRCADIGTVSAAEAAHEIALIQAAIEALRLPLWASKTTEVAPGIGSDAL